ncbi:DNZ54_00345 family protein [Pantoea dispersa]|uniref:DNZ54_00345 family protein n=1 Tax=Pantoea dispersa TaxID=59814 RepID=UPI0039896700
MKFVNTTWFVIGLCISLVIAGILLPVTHAIYLLAAAVWVEFALWVAISFTTLYARTYTGMARQKMHLLLHHFFRLADVLPLQWYHRTFIGGLLSGADWKITSLACLFVVIAGALLSSERAEART